MAVSLKQIPLFRDLRKDELNAIAKKVVVKSFDKNAVVITEGEFSKSLYFILSGRVKVHLDDEDGKEFVLDIKGSGEYFGEMVLDEGPRSASVSTIEPCEFAIISITVFKNLLLKHPEIALRLIKNLIHMDRVLNRSVRSLVMLDVYGRVSRMLIDLADEREGEHVISEKPTPKEMASRVGTSREMIQRILRDLSAGGFIRVEGKRIFITKPLPLHYFRHGLPVAAGRL